MTLQVTWKPTATTGGEIPPICRLSYLTAPGLVPGSLPGDMDLEAQKDEHGTVVEFRGATTISAPFFHPLRVRIELQPAFGSPLAHVVHVIPKSSAWASTMLVIGSLCALVALTWPVISPLRVTSTQAILGAIVLALAVLGAFVLRAALTRLRSNDLPYLGITYLVHRSLIACTLGFAATIALLQQCVVVIHNETEDDVELELSWRERGDTITAGAQISLVPPSHEELVQGLLGSLGSGGDRRPLCVSGLDVDELRCREALKDDWRLHPFTPATLVVGCGRKWREVSGSRVLPGGRQSIHVEGEDVWLEPPEGSHCGRDAPSKLWYEASEGNAAHHVRHPWKEADLEACGALTIAMVDDATAHDMELTLRSKAAAGEGEAFAAETLIRLAWLGDREARWRLQTLPLASGSSLTLEFGEPLRELSDAFSPAATLECRPTRHDAGLRATRLRQWGSQGWLTRLDVGAASPLPWSSLWSPLRASSYDLAAPWICEAFPGDDPHITQRKPFASESMVIHVAPHDGSRVEPWALVVPAYLMPHHVRVEQGSPDQRAHDGSPAANGAHVGTVTCDIDVGTDELVFVGRIEVDDRRYDRAHGLGLRLPQPGAPAPGVLTRWIPAQGAPQHEAWICWTSGTGTERVEVLLDHEGKGPAIGGALTIGESEASLELDAVKKTTCILEPDGDLREARSAIDPRLYRAVDSDELHAHRPGSHRCDRIYSKLDEGDAPK